MLYDLLSANTASAVESAASQNGDFFSRYGTWIMLGVVVALMIVYFVFSNNRRKKQEKQLDDMMNALTVGDKIMTIGRWYGEIVEVLPDGMFVVMTGSEEHPGYVKIEKATIAHIFKKTEEQKDMPDELPPENVFEEGDDKPETETAPETTDAPETTEETEKTE